jgi:ATP-binding cassette subfamily B protein AbcA/BmrA
MLKRIYAWLDKSVVAVSEQTVKKGIWRPFFTLIHTAKLPYAWVGFTLLFSLVTARVMLLFPEYTQEIMSGNFSQPIVYGAALIVIAGLFLASIQQFFESITKAKIDRKMRRLIWQALMKQSIGFFDKNKAREMVSRTTTDTTNLSTLVLQIFVQQITIIYMFVQTIIILNQYDWRLSASLFVIIPLSIASTYVMGKLNFRIMANSQQTIAHLTQFLAEVLINIGLVKAFANETKEDKRGHTAIDKLYTVTVKSKIIVTLGSPINIVLSVGKDLLIIGLGVYFIDRGTFGIDVWIAYYLYAQNLIGQADTFISTWTDIKNAQGATEKIAALLKEPGEQYVQLRHYKQMAADLFLKDICFQYDERLVLDHVSITIPRGKVTAIVGPSGSGKTTILNLVERFYTPAGGSISLGNIPVSEYHLKSWRNAVGYVAQDNALLSGTIRDNILYGVEREVPEDELIMAARDANIMEFVEALSEGLDTEVGEGGAKLSGGQRQRIAIARAILRKPDFLLLDEATASLDAESEYEVQQGLIKLMAKCTTIVVAHKLTTIVDADQIVVLKDGQVAGTGTHQELMKTNELYKELVELQMTKDVA